MCGAGEFGKASAISAASVASLSGGRESTRSQDALEESGCHIYRPTQPTCDEGRVVYNLYYLYYSPLMRCVCVCVSRVRRTCLQDAPLLAAADEDEACVGLCEAPRTRLTDPRSRSGDENRLTSEVQRSIGRRTRHFLPVFLCNFRRGFFWRIEAF